MYDAQSHFFYHCPHCSAGLRIRRAYLGQQVCCKQCDQVFVAAEGPDEGGGGPGTMPAPPLPEDQAERIVLTCPNCSAALSFRRAFLGRQVRCKQCCVLFFAAGLSGPRPSGVEQDRAPSDNGPDVLSDELERLRGELKQISAENQRLQPALDRIRAEHERLQAEHSELEAAHIRLQASHADLLTTDRTQASEIEDLRAAHDRIAAACDRLQADRDGLAAERDELRARGDALQEERDRLAGDLGWIRDELGEIAPGEVRVVAEERASLRSRVEWLRSEVERLGREVERLQDELASTCDLRSAFEDSVCMRQRQWEADLLAARDEVSRLAALVCGRDADLAAACAERNRIRAEQDGATAEAERLRATLARLEREQQQRPQQDGAGIDRLRAEIDRLREESDRRAALVRDREVELEAAVVERDRFLVERRSARVEVERLRTALYQLEREYCDRVERDGAELDRLRAMNEQLRVKAHRFAAAVASPDRDEELQQAHARLVSLQREVVYLRHLAREMRGNWASGQQRPPVPPGADWGQTALPGPKLA
jgi:chromosome segregation ATPase